ncbi:MAG: hypothetical protein HOH04_14430 [Rhodospirillaceae bacterium]|jgi:peptidyl-prolyl cis-trans isomerase SurA|nr:hypothetical protein [Rhodospirillaceae bacterium]
MVFSLKKSPKVGHCTQAWAWRSLNGILVLFICIFTPTLQISGAQAQQSLVIAATVNDEMISILDINSRLALSIRLAELPDTKDTRQRLAGQTLRAIIDDKLKLQEARKYQITANRRDISRAEKSFEQRAGLGKGGLRKLLKRLGLDSSSVIEQLEAQIVWSRLVVSRYRRTTDISEKEIDDFIADLLRNKGRPEFLVSEIFLPTGGNQDANTVRVLADRLIQQINSGANFSAVARNFSQSASAAQGGSLGWHRAGQLPTEQDSVIRRMSPGEVAGPIETIEGFYILKLDQQRTIEPFREEAPLPPTVTLHQAHFALPEGATETLVAETMTKASQVSAAATSCLHLGELSKKFASPLSGKLGTFKLDQLSEQLQVAVSPLPINKASPPIRNAGGIVIVMVCERKTPKVKKADPADRRVRIKAQLGEERINLAAEQYLRNLRRAAIVDVRL